MQSGRASFFNDVWDVVKMIPKGRVTSYGAIARYLGASSSARMVGWALHLTPETVPAHRVVNREGRLTGKIHFNPPQKMQQLLQAEGIRITEDRVEDFVQLFWDPAKELL